MMSENKVIIKITSGTLAVTAYINGKIITKATAQDHIGFFESPKPGGFGEDLDDGKKLLGTPLDNMAESFEVNAIANELDNLTVRYAFNAGADEVRGGNGGGDQGEGGSMNNMKKTAYCWASGKIKIGTKVPEGAIPIISGPENKLRAVIQGTARLARDNKTLLVPGIPEASNQEEALNALFAYINWIKPGMHIY